MAKVDRSILQANDQNNGDFGDPNKLEASISHLADRIDGNDNETQTLKTDNTSNKERLDTLESDVSTLETDNTNNKSRITSLEGDNANNKNRLTTLETDNTSNKSRITTNESNIAFNEGRLVELLRNEQKASEVVDARMGFPVLRDKLESVDAQLADTAVYATTFKTASNSWTDALDDCIKYCINNSLKKIKLPSGEITIDRDLTYSGSLGVWDLIIEGDGKGIDGRGTSLKIAETLETGLSFDLSLPVAGAWRGITFRDMVIRGTGKESNVGLKLVFAQQALFENCGFEQLDVGCIITGGSHYPLFRNCYFTLCNVGVLAPNPDDNGFVAGSANNGKLENTVFRDCKNPVKIGDGGGWKMDNCDLEGENGAVILSSYNVLDNVRIERNTHAQEWIYIVYDHNRLFINAHSDGGHQPTPLMVVNGNFNDIYLTGVSLEIVDASSVGIHNTIHFSDYKLLINRALIHKWKRPNYLNFTIPKGTDLLTQNDLKQWTKTLMNVTDSTFPDGSSCYQLVKSQTGEASIAYTVSRNFLKGETFYLTLEKQNVAGGGWEVQIADVVYDMNSYFDDLKGTISIIGYVVPADTNSLTVKIKNAYGGAGSAMNVGQVVGSNLLSGDFNI